MNPLTSVCRHCRHYKPEGRRGGQCQVLSVSVQSNWKACHFAMPPFAVSWEESQNSEIGNWHQELESKNSKLPESHSLEIVSKSSSNLITV